MKVNLAIYKDGSIINKWELLRLHEREINTTFDRWKLEGKLSTGCMIVLIDGDRTTFKATTAKIAADFFEQSGDKDQIPHVLKTPDIGLTKLVFLACIYDDSGVFRYAQVSDISTLVSDQRSN